MNKKIFRLSFLSSVVVLVISFALVFWLLFGYFEGQILSELESEADYIAHAVENEGTSYIDSFDNDEKRITLVSPEGEVLKDTSADAATLDNHLNRAEIADAVKSGSGTSSRYSDTLMQKTLYYAVRLDDGNILRVSTTQSSIVVILLNLVYPMLIVILIALCISVFISHRVSKAVIEPINGLDLDNPANNVAYEELTPLLKKIAAQKRTIDAQISDAKKKQEEFRLITENMSEGFLVIDKNADVLTHNAAAQKLLGIDEITGGSVLRLNRTKGFRSVVEEALSGRRAESEISVEKRCYNLIANPVTEHERVIGAVIVIIDITETARREQLRREFTSNVSHELKTPLTSISGFAEIMKAGGTAPDTVVDFSTSIYEEAGRMITLVSDIIKLSELDENAVREESERVDLYELAEDVLHRLGQQAEKRGISLNLIGDTAVVLGAKALIDEMIYNLCDNAIKYNKDGGTVDVILSGTSDAVSIIVRDTGIGIPFADQGRVFERFYRVDKSHSKKVGGTGLGLSIVKHAAIYHNAEINLESTEGVGTTITVIFKK